MKIVFLSYLLHTCQIIMCHYAPYMHCTHVFVCTVLYVCVVSEDTHSMDMTFRDNEDRGFYTETFHSSAWIYEGDDVSSGAVPPSLNTRTRAVSSKPHIVILQEHWLYCLMKYMQRRHLHGTVQTNIHTYRPTLNKTFPSFSVRERTVKISKGTGEYPWGFRIQFSKPIVVTEVDTSKWTPDSSGVVISELRGQVSEWLAFGYLHRWHHPT